MDGMLGIGRILVGKYRVESVLGRGGMGLVLKVMHLDLGEELAIKLLLPEAASNPEVKARFLREARSAVRLRGEHVARVTDVGVLPEGSPFMVMEYLRGQDLAAELLRRTTVPPDEAVDYVLQACEALAEAHAQGIVHRDIKPANLFLTVRPDGTPLVKVLDFGISKAPVSVSSAVTRTEMVIGTPGYMSPEQMKASRDVDARTDIWALGTVLYELLSGHRPFEAESYSAVVLMAATEPPPPLPPRLPKGLQAAVLRCLEKDRRARFPSIAALAAALTPFARNRHEALTIAERTGLLLSRASAASDMTGPSTQSGPTATTITGSAGAMTPQGRPRVLAGSAMLLGFVVVLTAAAVMISDGSSGSQTDPGDPPGSMATASLTVDPGGAAPSPVDGGIVLDVADVGSGDAIAAGPEKEPPEAMASEKEPPAVEHKGRQKISSCSKLEKDRRWQRLLTCAAELEALDESAQAQRFRAVATTEAVHAVADGKARRALAAENLAEAQTLLTEIAADSVYHQPLRRLFDQRDAANVERVQRKVQAFLKHHDCQGLQSYRSQSLGAANTERVREVLDRATDACVTATTASATGSGGHAAMQEAPPAAAPAKASADGGAGNARPRSDGPWLPSSPESGAARDASPNSGDAPPRSGCKVDVDAVIAQAKVHFNAKQAQAALELMNSALECKQGITMYRLATMYACHARELGTARQYFSRVPVEFRSGLIQICQREGLELSAAP